MNDRDERTGAAATSYLFTGGRLLDPSRDTLLDGFEALVENIASRRFLTGRLRREGLPGSIFPAGH
jgi:hypothetical protein